ncbi:hypothetical protein [Acidiplasma aeolicum]|jgi:hypothetical protein|uniref:hypothetical protein n=1 Tax=Acidiplasma aeolicum TaxID=507754 RepID=UPI003718CE3B
MMRIITFYVDELNEKAKSKGLNLFKFFESKLREFRAISFPELKRLSDTHPNKIPVIPVFGEHKRDYEKWLISRQLNDGYIKDLMNTLTRLFTTISVLYRMVQARCKAEC